MANKPGDDEARDILYEWGKTQPGERLLGTYPNAFGDLRDLIAAKVATVRQAAAQDAYERAARLSERTNSHGRFIAELIRALAAAEAEEGDDDVSNS